MAPFLFALVCLFAATSAAAAPPPSITLREFAAGFVSPTEIAHAGDGSGRVFVVEQTGAIRIVKDGIVLPVPFLDISALTINDGERGLLGLAFHPQYKTNGRFFVYYTRREDGMIHLAAFQVSGSDPDRASLASQQVLLTIPHPGFTNHNGGHLAFGPDGYLYIGTGDGGSQGDPPNNSQSLSQLLGKLLRIDVDASPYRIPPDNPFVSTPGARPEIWAYGLRNPWKFTFDLATNDLYIGDVGQSTTEEIDFVPAGSRGGMNFGWRAFEGTNCFNGCSLPSHTLPVLQYAHEPGGGSALAGGYVYRGFKSVPMRGYYFYGDFDTNRVWAAIREGSTWSTYVVVEPPTMLSGVSTFGQDEAGELYVSSFRTGRIYSIIGPGPEANPASRFDAPSPGPCRRVANAPGTGNPLQRQPDDCHAWRIPP